MSSGYLGVPGGGGGNETAASSVNSTALTLSFGDDLQYMDSESSDDENGVLDFASMWRGVYEKNSGFWNL